MVPMVYTLERFYCCKIKNKNSSVLNNGGDVKAGDEKFPNKREGVQIEKSLSKYEV